MSASESRRERIERRLQFSAFFVYLLGVISRVGIILTRDVEWPRLLVPTIIMILDAMCLICAFMGRTRWEERLLAVNMAMGFTDATVWSLMLGATQPPEMTMLRFSLPAFLLYRRCSLEWMGDED